MGTKNKKVKVSTKNLKWKIERKTFSGQNYCRTCYCILYSLEQCLSWKISSIVSCSLVACSLRHTVQVNFSIKASTNMYKLRKLLHKVGWSVHCMSKEKALQKEFINSDQVLDCALSLLHLVCITVMSCILFLTHSHYLMEVLLNVKSRGRATSSTLLLNTITISKPPHLLFKNCCSFLLLAATMLLGYIAGKLVCFGTE